MTTTDEQGEIEKAAAEALIAAAEPFPGVESVRVELGDDYDGDPSIWIVFRLRPEVRGDVPWIRKFSKYTTSMSIKLINHGLTRFPYTRIEPAA